MNVVNLDAMRSPSFSLNRVNVVPDDRLSFLDDPVDVLQADGKAIHIFYHDIQFLIFGDQCLVELSDHGRLF